MAKKRRKRKSKKKNNRKLYLNKVELMEQHRLTESLIKNHMPAPQRGWELGLGKDDNHHYWSKEEVAQAMEDPSFQRDFAKVEAMRRKQQEREAAMRKLLLSFGGMEMIESARTMTRRVVIHEGLTNSGKTYDALQALKKAKTGAYLGPLRLLALEVFDTLNEAGVPCSLLTGEEKIDIPFSEKVASTIEMCDFQQHYDVVVIDEAHLVADRERGCHWTRAILSMDTDELHLCTAPEGLPILESLIRSIGAEYQVVHHERLTPLEFAGVFEDFSQVEPGDALITFSRREVLRIAAELEKAGIQASVVYGALPPPSRREEVRKFSEKKTTVVVATDAIGMGVSLPIKRVIFCKTKKFDGVSTRKLKVSEIKQIAGRAGRYGIYDVGEVMTMDDPELIETALHKATPLVTHITIPFPQEALDSPYPLSELLEVWQGLPEIEDFHREDMSEAMLLYQEMKPIPKKATKEEIFSCITCPVDVKSDELVAYWKECCQAFFRREPLPRPVFVDEQTPTLEGSELQYAALDILSRMLKKAREDDNTMQEKMALCEQINDLLLKTKEDYLRRCRSCGAYLPMGFKWNICQRCFKAGNFDRGEDFRRFGRGRRG